MRTIIFSFLLAAMVSCKPSENNYRKAYEAAKQRTEQTGLIEGTVYESIRALGSSGSITTDRDTIQMMTVPVKLSVELNVPNILTKYCIAIGQFKQRFNARSLMTRVHEQGFSEATIVQNAEPLYYVVIPGATTTDEAVTLFRKVGTLQDSIQSRPPYPLILEPVLVHASQP